MSEVISFRLDPNNAREALAIKVIQTKQRDGYTLRQIMSDALLKLDTDRNDRPDGLMSTLYQKLDEISVQIQKIGNSSFSFSKDQNGESPDEELSRRFIETIRMSLKPGVQLGD